MLLTVSEVEGLSDGMDELSDEELPSAVTTATIAANKQLPAHPSVVMVSAKPFSGCTHTNRDPHMRIVCTAFISLFTLPDRPLSHYWLLQRV